MKPSIRKYISLFLCLCIFIQPFLYNAAVYADSTTDQLRDQASGVSEQQGSKVGSAEADENATDSEKQTASDAQGRDSSEMNKLGNSSGEINDAANDVDTERAKEDNSSVSGLAKVTAGIQKVLITVGNLLIKIGSLLKTVGQALQAIGAVLSAIPWTAAIGQALQKIGKILYQIGTVVEAIGKLLKATGEGAASVDQLFGQLVGTVKDSWKKGGEEADKYQEELNSEFASKNEGTTQEQTTTETQDATEDNSSSDVNQGEAADF